MPKRADAKYRLEAISGLIEDILNEFDKPQILLSRERLEEIKALADKNK